MAVAGLSFASSPGEVLGLVGPNGAGKTTTLRAVAGIIPPTQGRLMVAGHDVVADPVAAKRGMAYVPDDPKLFESLTVWEHLEFVAAAYRVGDFAAKAEELLRAVGACGEAQRAGPGTIAGMRQKVAIACAYLHDPQAILFDEPLTGLDPAGIRTAKESIVRRAGAGARGDQFPSAGPGGGHLHASVDPLSRQAAVPGEDRGGPAGLCRRGRAGLAGRGLLLRDRALERAGERLSDGPGTGDSVASAIALRSAAVVP